MCLGGTTALGGGGKEAEKAEKPQSASLGDSRHLCSGIPAGLLSPPMGEGNSLAHLLPPPRLDALTCILASLMM